MQKCLTNKNQNTSKGETSMNKETKVENNQVTVSGEVISGFTYSHEIYGEKFYAFDLRVKRLSDQTDDVPIIASERLIDVNSDFIGQHLKIEGQFRSYNKHEGPKNRLILSVFAREAEVLESAEDEDINSIILEGYICKEPVYRKTPLGREIGDVLLAVNRAYGKSDYIPCISWGRDARYLANFAIGSKLSITGRIQSRKYNKKLEDESIESRVAYEVSISRITVADEE